MSDVRPEHADFSAGFKEDLPPVEPERRPFHETLVQRIGRVNSATINDLLTDIQETTIPANHAAIFAAVVEIERMPDLSSFSLQFGKMKDAIIHQKAEAEARAAEKAKLATDADKVAELVKLVEEMACRAQEGSFLDIRRAIAHRIRNARTKKELKEALK